MRSNGFGSYIQKIVVHVLREHSDEVANLLGVEPFAHDPVFGRSFFRIQRKSISRGDDEGVVDNLSHDLPFRLKWKVDWAKSEY